MPAYNTTFELSIDDLQLIEEALQREKSELSAQRIDEACPNGAVNLDGQLKGISELLGRLHNQKVFYRPKSGVYVGG